MPLIPQFKLLFAAFFITLIYLICHRGFGLPGVGVGTCFSGPKWGEKGPRPPHLSSLFYQSHTISRTIEWLWLNKVPVLWSPCLYTSNSKSLDFSPHLNSSERRFTLQPILYRLWIHVRLNFFDSDHKNVYAFLEYLYRSERRNTQRSRFLLHTTSPLHLRARYFYSNNLPWWGFSLICHSRNSGGYYIVIPNLCFDRMACRN